MTKTSTSATTTEQRTHLYSTVVSQPSTSCHKTQADKEFSSNPSPALKSPSSAPSIVVPDTPNPSTPQPPQDTHTNAFYIHFDPKIWKDETAVLVALNSEYPFLTYNSVTIFEYILKKLVLCIQIRFVSTEKTTRIALRASCYLYHRKF